MALLNRCWLVLSLSVVVASGWTGHAKAQRGGCTVLSTVGPSFGGYSWLESTPNDSVGHLEFQCDNVAQIVRIEMGRGKDRGSRPRELRLRGARLEYNLYLDAGRTLVWGDGTRGTSVHELRPPNGVVVSLPVYGRIPAGQRVPSGDYKDTITVVLQF